MYHAHFQLFIYIIALNWNTCIINSLFIFNWCFMEPLCSASASVSAETGNFSSCLFKAPLLGKFPVVLEASWSNSSGRIWLLCTCSSPNNCNMCLSNKDYWTDGRLCACMNNLMSSWGESRGNFQMKCFRAGWHPEFCLTVSIFTCIHLKFWNYDHVYYRHLTL